MANHVLSGGLSAVLALSLFAGMLAGKSILSSTQMLTILGGFLGANGFLFTLTAVSNLEMEVMGDGFQARLLPEVVLSLLAAVFVSGIVHRVCITVCILFSLGFLYVVSSISTNRYGVANPPAAMLAGGARKKK